MTWSRRSEEGVIPTKAWLSIIPADNDALCARDRYRNNFLVFFTLTGPPDEKIIPSRTDYAQHSAFPQNVRTLRDTHRPGIRRRALANSLECRDSDHPRIRRYPSRTDLAEIDRLDCYVAIVDLDRDVEGAISAIASICGRNILTTVMAYSGQNDATLLRRSMQAGAREFLSEPLLPGNHARGVRARLRPAAALQEKKAPGKMLVFVPPKGGLASRLFAANFAWR